MWNVLNSRPKSEDCLSIYANSLLSTLLTSWKNLNTEEIAVSVVLAQAARFDEKLLRTIFKTKVATRQEMQQELKAFSFKKTIQRHAVIDDSACDAKRIKLCTNVRCHFCGKNGHKIADCRARNKSDKIYGNVAKASSSTTYTKDKSSVVCYKCGNIGHIASHCSRNNNASGSKQIPVEKRVDVCTIEPTGALIQW